MATQSPTRPYRLTAALRILLDTIEDEVGQALDANGHAEIRGGTHRLVVRAVCTRPHSITELAQTAYITRQSMGAAVDHLERHGYVRTRHDTADGRVRTVYPTTRARAAEDAVQRRLHDVQDQWRRALGAERFDQVTRLLDDLADHIRSA